jgi:hypothetical protein
LPEHPFGGFFRRAVERGAIQLAQRFARHIYYDMLFRPNGEPGQCVYATTTTELRGTRSSDTNHQTLRRAGRFLQGPNVEQANLA